MTDATRAVLSRIDMALAADESAEAVAWLEADFERKYAAYQAGEWQPSNCARRMMELLDDESDGPLLDDESDGPLMGWLPGLTSLTSVAWAPEPTLATGVDLSGFTTAVYRAAESLSLTFQQVSDAFTKLCEAFAEMPVDVDRSAMRADYDRRRRARRRRKRR